MAETGKELRAIARGGILNLIGAGASVLVNLGTTIAMTRVLSRAGAGRFFAATSLFLLFESIVISGATTGVLYFVARSRARQRFGDVRRALRFAGVPVVSASLGLALLTPLWTPWAARLLIHGRTTVPVSALIVLLAGLPLAAVSDTALAATAGYRLMRPTVVIERIGRPVLQGALVLIALPSHNPTLLVGAWVAPYLLSSTAAVLWLRRLVRRDPANDVPASGVDPDGADARPLTRRVFWAYTAPRGVAAVAQTALQRLDIVLVSVLSGAANAALYTAATRFLVVGQLIGSAVASSVQPRLAGWFAVGNEGAVSRTYRTATSWVILSAWPFYLICGWTAAFWLNVFGSGYSSAVGVVLILGGSMLLATGCGMVSTVLVMGGRTKDNLFNTVVALVLNVGIDVVLIPHIGIIGAAIGWAISIAANNLLPLSQIWRQLSMHPLGAATLRSAVLALTCLGAIPAVAVGIGGYDVVAVLVGCVVGSLVYVGVVVRFYRSFDLHAFRRHRAEVTSST